MRLKRNRLLRIELRLMEAEYLLDSAVAHCRQAKCRCIGPRMRRRIEKALNKVRAARDLVRNEQGHKQWTLFAGSSSTQLGKGKTWAHHTPHKWAKDCHDNPAFAPSGTILFERGKRIELAPDGTRVEPEVTA